MCHDSEEIMSCFARPVDVHWLGGANTGYVLLVSLLDRRILLQIMLSDLLPVF